MTPEESARQEIDRRLAACGWIVQDRDAMHISAGPGVAIREFPLKGGEVDYLLYAAGKAVGVVEAKPRGHTLTGVETQSAKYMAGLPPSVPTHARPLPFGYESTGAVTQFTNRLEPDARSREVFAFHRPAELLELVRLPLQLRLSLDDHTGESRNGGWGVLPLPQGGGGMAQILSLRSEWPVECHAERSEAYISVEEIGRFAALSLASPYQSSSLDK